MKVAFIHPDLGIGGAERLVVDAAVGLQERGHDVTIFTSHCDRSHCFEEVSEGLLKVEVHGDFLPTRIFGRFAIVCAALRQLYLTVILILASRRHASTKKDQFDVFIVDQLSFCVPLIREFISQSRILFYCHFPDQLLSTRKSLTQQLYRVPFDKLEMWSTNQADVIVVNSKFTRGVFKKTFTGIKRYPDVIYPCVDATVAERSGQIPDAVSNVLSKTPFFLSVNRFERKKNIQVAIEAFGQLLQDSEEVARECKLVIAGGYDTRVAENREYLQELVAVVKKWSLTYSVVPLGDFSSEFQETISSQLDKQVLFFPSVPSPSKDWLMRNTQLLLYTPSFEHFGIVPLEAMIVGTPVLATATGGPLETVVDQVTGWTCAPRPEEWSRVMDVAMNQLSVKQKHEMSQECIKRVQQNFTRSQMAAQFEKKAVEAVAVSERPEEDQSLHQVFGWFRAASVVLLTAVIIAYGRRKLGPEYF